MKTSGSLFKRIKAVFAVIATVAGVLAGMSPTQAQAKKKYPRPDRPSVTIKENGVGCDIVLTIGKTKRAKGFDIYVKKPGSDKYVLLKTLDKDGTAKRSITIEDFEKTGNYYFKVRAFYNEDGKKIVSLYSKVKKYKITDAMIAKLKELSGGDGGLVFKDKNTVYFGHYPHTVPDSTMMKKNSYDYYEDYMHDRDAWAGQKTKSDPEGDYDRIEWTILEEREDSYLLMSKEVLDVVPMAGKRAICYYKTIEDDEVYALYDYEDKYVNDGAILTWQDTKLRSWLNKEFVEYAFTPEERKSLVQMQVDACAKEAGTCNDYVTIPSSENLEYYVKPDAAGDYAFDLVAEGTTFALYSQYVEEVGPLRNISNCDNTNGYRVLRRIYHSGGSATKVGYNWSGSRLDRDTYEKLGCPEELIGRNTVSYWLRDVDLSRHDELVAKKSDQSLYNARYGIYRTVSNDGRYCSLYDLGNLLSKSPLRNEGNLTLFFDGYWGTGMSGLRPIILVAKDKKKAVITTSGRGGVIGTTGKRYGGSGGEGSGEKDKDPDEEYTVEFVSNGGKGMMDPVKVKAGPYTLPECAFTKDNFEFEGWQIGDGDTKKPGTSIDVNSNIILFAKWKKLERKTEGSSYVYFGHYEQDGNTKNGKEPIEWMVLEDKGDTLVLMSQDIICHEIMFADEYNYGDLITWENCSLRKWLNKDFLKAAFKSEEQESIISRDWACDPAPREKDNRDGGKTVKDKVSILSREEVLKYFAGKDLTEGAGYDGVDIYSPRLLAKPSDAVAKSASNKDGLEMYSFPNYDKSAYKSMGYSDELLGDSFSYWWLRTPGYKGNYMLSVSDHGQINYIGKQATEKLYAQPGARPVIEVRASAVSDAKNVK